MNVAENQSIGVIITTTEQVRKNIFKCLFVRFMFCHQVDRLGVNKWRLREVGYENIFEDNTKKYQTNYLKIQAHVVCRMLGFTGARRAFTGCRWGTLSPSERLADSCGHRCISPSSDNPSNRDVFSSATVFRFGRCSNNFAVAGIGCSGEERSVADCRWEIFFSMH